MKLWSNPRSRWQLFDEMAQLSQAGVPIQRIVELFLERPHGGLFHQWAETTRRGLARHANIPDAMAEQLDAMEHSIVAAADSSGKLANGFAHLARYYEMQTEARRAALAALLYPLAVLNFAVILPALVRGMQSGNILGGILLGLLKLYAVIAAATFICIVVARLAQTSKVVDRFLGILPAIGKARRAMAISRWCLVSHFHTLAGRNVAESVLAAGSASQSPLLEKASQETAAVVREGNSLGRELMRHAEFPRDFAGAIVTAEEAGALDSTFGTWADRFFQTARQSMMSLAVWLPKFVYTGVAIYAALVILRMYQGIYSGLFSLMDAE